MIIGGNARWSKNFAVGGGMGWSAIEVMKLQLSGLAKRTESFLVHIEKRKKKILLFLKN